MYANLNYGHFIHARHGTQNYGRAFWKRKEMTKSRTSEAERIGQIAERVSEDIRRRMRKKIEDYEHLKIGTNNAINKETDIRNYE